MYVLEEDVTELACMWVHTCDLAKAMSRSFDLWNVLVGLDQFVFWDRGIDVQAPASHAMKLGILAERTGPDQDMLARKDPKELNDHTEKFTWRKKMTDRFWVYIYNLFFLKFRLVYPTYVHQIDP